MRLRNWLTNLALNRKTMDCLEANKFVPCPMEHKSSPYEVGNRKPAQLLQIWSAKRVAIIR